MAAKKSLVAGLALSSIAVFSIGKYQKTIKARGVEVVVGIEGGTQFHRNLDLLFDLLGDFDYAFELIEKDYYAGMKAKFAMEGKSDGGRAWKPLSPNYAKAKEFVYPGKKILEATGELKKSLTRKGAPGNINIRTDKRLILGSDVETDSGINLAMLHQRGFKRPKIFPVNATHLRWMGPAGQYIFAKSAKAVKVPPRPLFNMTSRQKDRWSKILHVAFLEEWNKFSKKAK